MENNYYVYEWIRLDTNEVIYVGKGKNDRAYELKYGRTKYFKDVIKNREVAVVILLDNLSEKEALQYESWYINEYKYVLGYPLTNQTDGGEGVSGWFDGLSEKDKENYRKNMSKILKQKYAATPGLAQKTSEKVVEFMRSPKQREKAKLKGIEKHLKQPDYFKNLSHDYRKTEESKIKASEHAKNLWNDEETRNKILEARKNSDKFKKNVHEANSIRFAGAGNPNAKKITLNINNDIVDFNCKKEAIIYLNEHNIQFINERTKKPIKKITKSLFNKKLSSNPYVDFNGNIISIV